MTKRIVVYRLAALAVLLTVFYGLDWMPLRVAQRNVIGWSLRVAEYDPVVFVHEGSPAFWVADEVYYYTAECTYLDLLMIVAPLVWVFGASRRSNLLRIAIAAVVILGGNLIRAWASVYFNVRGTDWVYSHDIPHYVIWSLTLMVVVGAALRRDVRRRVESCGKLDDPKSRVAA